MADTVFTLTPDDPCHTELKSSQGEIIYRVTTDRGEETFTRVFAAEESEIASLQWSKGDPDKVIYKQEKEISIVQWMKKSHVPFTGYVARWPSCHFLSIMPHSSHVSFVDEQGRKYEWKGLTTSHHLRV